MGQHFNQNNQQLSAQLALRVRSVKDGQGTPRGRLHDYHVSGPSNACQLLDSIDCKWSQGQPESTSDRETEMEKSDREDFDDFLRVCR